MKLGFVSAILPDQTLDEVLRTAADLGYQCVEAMCWPAGRSDRRYAGVTHVAVEGFTPAMADDVNALCRKHGVELSALGYYPNPLDPELGPAALAHLTKVMHAAKLLGLGIVNTFVGRDWRKSIDDNWPAFRTAWPPVVALAAELGLRLGIENCPMIFSGSEWPGGKNLATTPEAWRRMFAEIPSPAWGLNFDPSHFLWQFIDPVPALREFGDRLVHVHAKDARIDRDRLQERGIMGLDWHTPKLPGLGEVAWGPLFGALTDLGYQGAVCVEVEDRAFEKSPAERRRALVLSRKFLEQYVA
jgi:sugar phosphate isomerase/epimerase